MRVEENFNLKNYNSYRIDSYCAKAYFPDSEDDIAEIFANNENKIILGSGHNIILSKNQYPNSFVIFSGNFDDVDVSADGVIKAKAGIDMLSLSNIALENSLSGLEIFYDIPSSLGGAVVMNAGASGEDIKGLLVKARYYNSLDNTFSEIEKDEIGFEYRNSFFQKNPYLIITEAVLKLTPGSKERIKEKMETVKAQRWAKQPKELPNAGSVFKRPEGYFVGAIMDDLKLKGYSIGGAKISEKHGGFIVNHNNATGQDILDLIQHVQKNVKAKYGFELEVEQRII